MKSAATFTWAQLLSETQGEAVSHHRPFETAALDSDTRTLDHDSFFVPLTGANFDGNDYIAAAYEAGAQGAFVRQAYLAKHPDLKRFPNLISVEEPLMAYLALARLHRRRCAARIVAVTGSSGKTTTKEMLFALLSSVLGDQVQKSEKNFNNEVGVALTLLNIRPSTHVMVLEMGMRGPNQISILSEYAEPDIGIITNIGPAHIGLLGSLDAIAKAKCELFQGMDPEKSLGIINGDDPLLVGEASRSWDGRLESYSLHEVDEIHTFPEGHLTFNYEDATFALSLPGSHNVSNALAGIKACEALGIPLKRIQNALADFEPGGARWQKRQLEGLDNIWMINDAYNANPASVKVALGAFLDGHYPGLTKVAIVGGMAELGAFSEHYHREIGHWVGEYGGLDALVVMGDEAAPLAQAAAEHQLPVYCVQDAQDVVALIQKTWPANAIFFLKASRSFQLEHVPELLTHDHPSHVLP